MTAEEGFALYFNLGSESHYLRVRAGLDSTSRGTQVYEALMDGRVYVFFEVELDIDGTVDVWSLFEAAIAAYRAQRADDSVTKTEWRE